VPAIAALVVALAAPAGALGPARTVDLPAPSAEEVATAEQAAGAAARGVAAVRADLALARQELDASSIRAAQAAEQANRTAWELREAKRSARAARAAADAATAQLDAQQAAYRETLVGSYQSAPQVESLAAMVESDGIETYLQRAITAETAVDALEGSYDRFRASAVLSESALASADRAQEHAESLADEARAAQESAQATLAAAAQEAAAIEERRSSLVSELAQLQGVSVALAAQRQTALEERAARAVARAEERRRQEAARLAREQQVVVPTPTPAPTPTRTAAPTPVPTPTRTPVPTPTRTPTPTPTPTPPPTPAPAPSPTPTPAPSPPPASPTGARAAIAFATAQLGEPYRWGAAGPDAWDCSGLTAMAWAAGGVRLPHYSAGQYAASTPVRPSELAPGDLVFWGSSSSPSSIYHVALYVGDGMIVHAPRTGRPVVKESMYYWRTPNFYARP